MTKFRAIDCLRVYDRAKSENFSGKYTTLEQMQIMRAMYDSVQTYFIVAPDVGLLKLGKAKDVNKRFKTLCSSSPVPLEIRAVIPFTGELEPELSKRFASYKKLDSWLHYNDDMIEIVMLARSMRPSEFLTLLHEQKYISDEVFNSTY